MTQEQVNWTQLRKDADDATKPLPVDWYDLVVEKAEHKKAQTGSDMIFVQFKVDAGVHAGKTVFTNLVFSPEKAFALNIFFKNLEALGIGADFFAGLQSSGASVESALTTIAQAITGRPVRAQVSIRNWQGQDRNQIDTMAPANKAAGGLPGGPPPVTMPGAAGNAGGPPVPPAGPPTPAAAPGAADAVKDTPPTPPPAVPY